MQGLSGDTWIQSQIDAAVAPYAGRLSAEEIDWMRGRLAEMLATELHAKDLLQRARPRGVVEASGEVRCGPLADVPEHVEASTTGKKRRGSAG